MAYKKNSPLKGETRLNLGIEKTRKETVSTDNNFFGGKSDNHSGSGPALGDTIPDDDTTFSVGERLRFQRERSGYSLHEMAEIIRLKPRQIQALENGDYDNLPGRAFVTGFLRSYANALDLDAVAIVELYKREHAGQMAAPQLAFPEPTSEGRKPGASLLVGTCLAAAVAFGGWYFYLGENKDGLEIVPDLPNRLLTKLATITEEKSPTEQNAENDSDVAIENESSKVSPVDVPSPEDEKVLTGPEVANSGTENNEIDAPASLAATQSEQIDLAGKADNAEITSIPHTGQTEEEAAEQIAEQGSLSSVETATAPAIAPAPAPIPETASETATLSNPESTEKLLPRREGTSGETDQKMPNNSGTNTQTALVQTEKILTSKKPEARASAPLIPTETTDIGRVEVQQETISQPATPDDQITRASTFKQETIAIQDQIQMNQFPANSDASRQSSEIVSDDLGIQNSNSRLLVIAHQETWIQILGAENDIVLEQILHPGDTYMVPSRDDLKLNTANAAGIEIRLDGQTLSSLGGFGTIIRELDLNPDLLKERYSTIQ